MRGLSRSMAVLMLCFGICLSNPLVTLAQMSNPTLITIEMPTRVAPGDSFEILVRARNDGSLVERGYISVSVPDVEPGFQFEPISSQMQIKQPGTTIVKNDRNDDGSYMTMSAHDFLIEGEFFNWEAGGERELRFKIQTKDGVDQVISYIRATFCNGSGANLQCQTTPVTSNYFDQQGFMVERYVIEVGNAHEAEEIPVWMIVIGVILALFLFINAISTKGSSTSPESKASIEVLRDKFYCDFGDKMRSARREIGIKCAIPLNEDQKEQAYAFVDCLYRHNAISKLIDYGKKNAPERGWNKLGTIPHIPDADLKKTLLVRFDEQELRELCIEAGIDYERKLEGSTFEEKAEALALYVYRHNYFNRLEEAGKSRIDINWPQVKAETRMPLIEVDPVKMLADRFNEVELSALCLELGIDYESDLPGNNDLEKAQSLVDHCKAHNMVGELLNVGKDLRKDIGWEHLKF